MNVHAKHPFQYSGHHRRCIACGEVKGHELHALPHFEAGKTYRTRGGRLMKITGLTPDRLTGTEQNQDPTDRHVILYSPSGVAEGTGWSAFDLLPGAIEDEPKAESDAAKAYRAAFGRIPGDPFPGDVPWKAALQGEINQRKSAAVDPIPVLLRDIAMANQRIHELERGTTSDREAMWPRIGVLADRLKAEEQEGQQRDKRLAALEDRCTNLGHKADGAHTRVNALANHEAWDEMTAVLGRIEEMETALGGKANGGFAEGHRKRIEALEKAAEAMPGPYAMGQRLEALEEQMTAALGITFGARPRPATPVELAIQALDGRINDLEGRTDALSSGFGNVIEQIQELENYTGLDVRSAKRESYLDQLVRFTKTKPGGDGIVQFETDTGAADGKPTVVDSASWTGRPTPPKPTIKGGWVNVYRDRSGVAARIGDYVWADKEDADAAGIDRIACIQIPDITEGEGL